MAQTKTTTPTKSRGKFLTIMIVLAAFGAVTSLNTIVNSDSVAMAYGNVPSWFTGYAMVSMAISVATVIGLWMMKRWAAYLLAASTIIGLITPIFILKPLDPNVGNIAVVMASFGAGLWFWAIYRKWNEFD